MQIDFDRILRIRIAKWIGYISGGEISLARREFLTYCLSLMRAHNAEHRDSLPVLDVSALRHVAYVFDALVYYMRSLSEPLSSRGEAQKESSNYTGWNDQVRINIGLFVDISFSVGCCYIDISFTGRKR